MRKPHYWKVAGAKSAPSNIIVFDCETHFGPTAKYLDGELQTLRLGVALAYRLERSKRTRIKKIHFSEWTHFWDFVATRLDKKRPLWIFGHNIGYDLGCVSFHRWRREQHFVTDKSAVSGSVFWLKGSLNGYPMNFCDTLNYFRVPLAKLGKSVGLPKMEMPPYEASDQDWIDYCANDVYVTAKGIDKLIEFVRVNALGPWQPTVAGLSFAAYRSCFMRHKVLVHTYKEPLRLERGAYYGGVVDTPLLMKKIPGPVYEMDVCSMYPSVCTRDLPVKFVRDGQRYGPTALKRLLKDFIVIADVTLNTPRDVYPIRLKRGTYYPTGRYRTILAHPELVQAVERGHVEYIHSVAYYTRAPIFKEYMEWFVAQKVAFKKKGDEAFEFCAKMFATNLYGKTGQMTPKWQQWGEESLKLIEQKWGLKDGELEEWYGNPPTLYDPDETFRFRQLPESCEVRDYFGIVEIKVSESESRDSCPVIAATVTSYARCLLRNFQECAGPGNWFYSDTDSIWVNQTGRNNLEKAGHVKADTLGFLTEQKIHDWLIVRGPKDYESNLTIKLKGVKNPRNPNKDGSYTQLQFPSSLVQLRDGICEGVYVRHVTKHLKRKPTKCKLQSDGSTRPLSFPSEQPT